MVEEEGEETISLTLNYAIAKSASILLKAQDFAEGVQDSKALVKISELWIVLGEMLSRTEESEEEEKEIGIGFVERED